LLALQKVYNPTWRPESKDGRTKYTLRGASANNVL